MGLLSWIKKKKNNHSGITCGVELDTNGKVVYITAPEGSWTARQQGQYRYFTQKAQSLLHAAEILKKKPSIPQFTYYTVDTPDGTLGRDMNGFYTEARIKTKGLKLETERKESAACQAESLTDFGNSMNNAMTVAGLQKNGQYASLILLMKCGKCGYESPVETQEGEFDRECCCCGAVNHCERGGVNVFMGGGFVKV